MGQSKSVIAGNYKFSFELGELMWELPRIYLFRIGESSKSHRFPCTLKQMQTRWSEEDWEGRDVVVKREGEFELRLLWFRSVQYSRLIEGFVKRPLRGYSAEIIPEWTLILVDALSFT